MTCAIGDSDGGFCWGFFFINSSFNISTCCMWIPGILLFDGLCNFMCFMIFSLGDVRHVNGISFVSNINFLLSDININF